MKRMIAALVMLLIIVGLNFCALKTVNGISGKTEHLIKECKTQYKNGETVNSAMTAEQLRRYWQKHESVISIFCDRDPIDKLSQSVVKIAAYTKNKSDTDFLAECSIARELLREIKSSENPSIHSMF